MAYREYIKQRIEKKEKEKYIKHKNIKHTTYKVPRIKVEHNIEQRAYRQTGQRSTL